MSLPPRPPASAPATSSSLSYSTAQGSNGTSKFPTAGSSPSRQSGGAFSATQPRGVPSVPQGSGSLPVYTGGGHPTSQITHQGTHQPRGVPGYGSTVSGGGGAPVGTVRTVLPVGYGNPSNLVTVYGGSGAGSRPYPSQTTHTTMGVHSVGYSFSSTASTLPIPASAPGASSTLYSVPLASSGLPVSFSVAATARGPQPVLRHHGASGPRPIPSSAPNTAFHHSPVCTARTAGPRPSLS